LLKQVPLVHPSRPNTDTPSPQLPDIPTQITTAPFRDVASDRWSAARIQYLKQLGMIQGYPDGTFRPTQPVTRAELVVMLQKANSYLVELRGWNDQVTGNSQSSVNFSDLQGHWAQRSIQMLSEYCPVASPLNEIGTAFAPNTPATRAYTAATLIRSWHCLNITRG
jgi:S-layer homology domain